MITLRNSGGEDVAVEVTRRAVGESAAFKSWVRVLPARQNIRAGRSARFTLRVSRSAIATPGDHSAVILLTTHQPRADGVAVRLRLGVRLIVRVPGPLVRRVEAGALRITRRRIVIPIANRGNVVIPLEGQIAATLRRRGRVAARLHARTPAVLLPGGRVAVAFPYSRRLRGTFTLEARLGRILRRYRVRL